MGGCTSSKLDNEDTVRRCKERRRFIKEAVQSRHNLATAHSDYLRSLRLTGSALFDFASGEPLSISDQTPAVLLRNPSSISSSSSFRNLQPKPPPPPPPRRQQTPYSSYSSSSPTISNPKLPHILSESTPSSTPFHKPSKKHDFPMNFQTNSNFSSTPSQASSVWNWENFYPPSPPGSDFFNHHDKQSNHEKKKVEVEEEVEEMETETETETEREEVQCSEWGDHYSTTSSDTKSDNEDLESRSEIGSRSNFGSSVHNNNNNNNNDVASTKSNRFPMKKKKKSDTKSDDAGSSVSWNIGGGGGGGKDDEVSDMKMVIRHRDLAEIAAAIKDYFENAATAGESVSDLLETSRAQLDRSFRQLKKTVYHSNSILSHLSSSFSSRPPLEIKYKLETGSLNEPDGPKSHCSTLDQLLAWESKLYQEVKAREAANIEHEKKLSSLQSQEYKGGNEAKLDKTKASIKRLQSLILVTSQAVSSTSSAIINVRDTELAPQLVELCHGFMYMWRSMNQFHELQNHIVQQVRGLVNRATKGESTSEIHRQATRHLESAVSSWHTSFCFLIKFQRDYVRSLHGWLKLTLHAIKDTTDTRNHMNSTQSSSSSSELFAFLDEWKQALDRLPDTVASESIKSFVNVVHVISTKQSEELKIKKRGDSAARELEKKASALRTIEKKFYQSYSMVGLGGLPHGSDGGQVFDARDPLSEKKQELTACQRRVEDEMIKYSKAVEITRAMTLNNIQTGLPGVFQALTMFSGLFTEVLEGVCTRSYAIK